MVGEEEDGEAEEEVMAVDGDKIPRAISLRLQKQVDKLQICHFISQQFEIYTYTSIHNQKNLSCYQFQNVS